MATTRQHSGDPGEGPDSTQQLTPTGRVILGMLSLGKQSGYDIKNFVDKTTRHFWAASYGQIYPELRRLEEQGLVLGRQEPTGGRARTVFELTDTGRVALQDWLRSDLAPLHEVRDEGMLKLFFSDSAGPQLRIDNIRAMRERSERKLAQLRELEPHASSGPKGPYLTLQLGIRTQECVIDWCRTTEQALTEEA
jgi:DNA-binding PadR family transcriptional regulator